MIGFLETPSQFHRDPRGQSHRGHKCLRIPMIGPLILLVFVMGFLETPSSFALWISLWKGDWFLNVSDGFLTHWPFAALSGIWIAICPASWNRERSLTGTGWASYLRLLWSTFAALICQLYYSKTAIWYFEMLGWLGKGLPGFNYNYSKKKATAVPANRPMPCRPMGRALKTSWRNTRISPKMPCGRAWRRRLLRGLRSFELTKPNSVLTKSWFLTDLSWMLVARFCSLFPEIGCFLVGTIKPEVQPPSLLMYLSKGWKGRRPFSQQVGEATWGLSVIIQITQWCSMCKQNGTQRHIMTFNKSIE